MKKSILKIIIALFLVGILMTGGCILGCASKSEEDKQIKDFQNTSGVIVGESESRGIKLTSYLVAPDEYASYDAAASGTYTLTATTDSADPAELTVLVWSIAFNNPSSTWASGKSVTSYVTMSVSSDTHSATLKCVAAFGEQIKVTVKSQRNTKVSASCKIDYVKRVTSIDVSHTSAGQQGKFKLSNNNTLTVTPTYGVGTVGGFGFTVTNRYFVDVSGYASATSQSYASSLGYGIKSQVEVPAGTHQVTPAMFINGDTSSSNYKLVYNRLVTNMEHPAARYGWKIAFTVTYNGTVYQSTEMSDSDTYLLDTSAVTKY